MKETTGKRERERERTYLKTSRGDLANLFGPNVEIVYPPINIVECFRE